MIFYGGRLFQLIDTKGDGDVGSETIFKYEQRGDVLMGTYSGGDVDFGSLVGKVKADGSLRFLYHHITHSGALKSGKCESLPEILKTGKIRLYERWEWTSGLGAGGRGTSLVEEM